MVWAQFPAGLRDFSFFQNMQTGCGAHLPSYPMGTRVHFLGIKQWGVKLTSHLYLVLRLRINWVVHVLPSWCTQVQPYLYLYTLYNINDRTIYIIFLFCNSKNAVTDVCMNAIVFLWNLRLMYKAVTLQACMGPQGCRRLRHQEFLDSWHMKVVRLSVLRFSCLDTPGDTPGTHFC